MDAKPKDHVSGTWPPKSSVVLTPGVGEPVSVATVVIEKKSLRRKMTSRTGVGWRHRKRHCASWHSTLTKLTLPHDANSVVQNKKETKNQTKEENPKHAQRDPIWDLFRTCQNSIWRLKTLIQGFDNMPDIWKLVACRIRPTAPRKQAQSSSDTSSSPLCQTFWRRSA